VKYHLTSNVLLHYLAKFECSVVSLNSTFIKFKSGAKYVHYTAYGKCLSVMLNELKQINLHPVFRISVISVHACIDHTCHLSLDVLMMFRSVLC